MYVYVYNVHNNIIHNMNSALHDMLLLRSRKFRVAMALAALVLLATVVGAGRTLN